MSVPQPAPTSAPTSAPAPVQPAQPSQKDENLSCQWNGCSEKFDNPEDLYNHLCDLHVGRKSTNNLCLTCAWGTCRTTTVKRDHITSHIRVHVPLKPHKCEFCGKAFKRPQDLKKHVKTHADDSVLLRSPEPDGTGRRSSAAPGNLHVQYTTSVGMQPLAATAAQAYYGSYLPSVVGTASHPPVAGINYYPNTTGAAPVYCYQQPTTGQEAIAQAATAAAATNDKKRAFDGVSQFFDDAKRHKIQPVYDGAMAQRLSALQFVPATTAEGVDFSVPAATATAPATTGPAQAFTLPALRTKQDLIDADNFLTQLSANVYENASQRFFATTQSQNGAIQTTQQQATNGAPPAPMGANEASSGAPTSNGYTAQSPHAQTPKVSPQASTAPMSYPTLPAVTTSDVSSGYTAPATSAPASLGPSFEADRQRVAVGVLQRSSEPAETKESVYPGDKNPSGTKQEISGSLIDPSLASLTTDTTTAPTAPMAPTPEKDVQRDKETISKMHQLIKELLAKEEARERNVDATTRHLNESHGNEDTPMGEAPDAAAPAQTAEEANKQNEDNADAQALYPILKAVAAC